MAILDVEKTDTTDSDIVSLKEKVRDIPVCIIIPPSVFLSEERVFPLLGPLKVAAELERNGNPVEVLDLSGYQNFNEIVSEYAQSTRIKNFGITATTPQLPAAAQIVESIREQRSDSRIILGGTHATLTYTSMLEDVKLGKRQRGVRNFEKIEKMADVIVAGDGEKAIFAAIDPSLSSKVIDASDSLSKLFLKRGELEQYSWPARHLIDMDSYNYSIDGHRATSLIAQLGCPFECGFCSGRMSQFLRMTRVRNTESAVAEMESIYESYKYTGFMFYDDELNVAAGSLEKLCRGVIDLQDRLGVEFRLRGFVRADLFNLEQAELMYKAGFRVLLSGFESGSDDMLDAMRKKTTSAINTKCREVAGRAGLKVKALMSTGHPGETEETIKKSIDWVRKTGPDDVDWTVITPYPGSPYFEKSVYDSRQKGWLYSTRLVRGPHKGREMKLWSNSVDYVHEADYYKGVPGEYKAHVWTEALSREDLVRLRDAAEAETRRDLNLPPILKSSLKRYEHSMGQSDLLPEGILRHSRVRSS